MNTNLAVLRPPNVGVEANRPRLEVVGQAHETAVTNEVVFVSELPGDEEIVAQAERRLKIRLVGDLAVKDSVECIEKPIKDLREGIVWASRGDEDGLSMVDANVKTEMIEQVYKAGNVLKTALQVDENDIYQHGQRMTTVANNAYHLASDDPIIKPRTVAEAKNIPRMKRLFDEGILEDYVFARFSMCAEDVSDEKLDELKFFSSTKSISVQMAYSENDQLVDEIAMVAGVNAPGSKRHDRKMVEGVAEYFDKSYEDKSTAEILEEGMLIPKEYVKNGVVDLVRIMDDINGGTFFGQEVSEQDRSEQGYVDWAEFCKRRAERFNDDVKDIRQQLIAEVYELDKAIVASQRLAKLVEQRMVDKALSDETIDPSVFGRESAKNLIRARELTTMGNHHEAQAFMQVALATAQGGSCPSALNKDMLKALGLTDPNQMDDAQKISKENAWAGTEDPIDGHCVNCDKDQTKKKKKVGVEGWCKDCIKGHCG